MLRAFFVSSFNSSRERFLDRVTDETVGSQRVLRRRAYADARVSVKAEDSSDDGELGWKDVYRQRRRP